MSTSAEHRFHPFQWSLARGALTLAPGDGRPLRFGPLLGSVEVDGALLHLQSAEGPALEEGREGSDIRRAVCSWTFSAPALRWTWELVERGPILAIVARLENLGDTDLRIGAWNVLHGAGGDGGVIDLGTVPDQVRFFGWRAWAMQVERFAAEASHHDSSNLCLLSDPATGTALLSSFVTLDRMLVRHDLDYSRAGGVEAYRATCAAGRYPLRPGQALESEVLELSYCRDPHGALESWADRVYERYQPDLREQPMVIWSGGAWIDTFSSGDESWEAVALANARALRERLPGFGVSHVWTSQHNLKEGLPGNWLTGNDEQIPSGMPAFLARLQELGLDHKLWFSPFWFFAEADDILDQNRRNLLRDDDGNPITRPRNWEWDHHIDANGTPRLTAYYLDGTHPGTQAYVRKVFEAYRQMGANAYMLDFLAILDQARLDDDSLLPVAAARQILQVIRDTVGQDAHLQTAVASTPGFIGLISAARVGRDFGEGRPLFPPFPLWHNATYVRHDQHFGNAHFFVQNAAANYFTHGKVYCNDLNILTVDKPVQLEQARIGVTMFGLAGGSPLTLGDDFRHIDPERLRLVKLCLPRTRGVPVPVDLFDRVAPDEYCRILKLPVSTTWDDYVLAAVYNREGDPALELTVDLGKLGLDPAAAHRVFEFWNEEYVGTFHTCFPAAVPPGAMRLYRIAPARPHPWLLGTDMHVQQGAVEIESLAWDDAAQTLSGVATRPAGERGNLFLLLPRQWRLVNHRGINLMKEVLDMTAMARVPLAFDTGRAAFELRFEQLDVPNVAWRGWLPYAAVEEWLEYVEEHRVPGDTRVVE